MKLRDLLTIIPFKCNVTITFSYKAGNVHFSDPLTATDLSNRVLDKNVLTCSYSSDLSECYIVLTGKEKIHG